MTTEQPGPSNAAVTNGMPNTGIAVNSQKRLMCGHARCTETANEININSMFNINIKANDRNVLEWCTKWWQPRGVNETQELQCVREPMKTQWLKPMALAVYSESVPALSIRGGTCVLKKGSKHCFHLFTQDNNIFSRAIKSNMITDPSVLQLTKNSKIFGKSQLY